MISEHLNIQFCPVHMSELLHLYTWMKSVEWISTALMRRGQYTNDL